MTEDLKQEFREKVLENGELRKSVLYPPFPERSVWKAAVEGLKNTNQDLKLIAYEDVQWIEDYEKRLEEKYEGGAVEISPDQVLQAAYDLNECHFTTEDMRISVTFDHDRRVVMRGTEESLECILDPVKRISCVERYFKPFSNREGLESDIEYQGEMLENVVEERAEASDKWISEKLVRPEMVEDYWSQLDSLMKVFQSYNSVYAVQTHPGFSLRVSPSHIKHSYPTQRYVVPEGVSWAARIHFNREMAIKGERATVRDVIEKAGLQEL
ncbi:MAG: hypothetical protein ABEJ03_06165 [Candidatus Nanohaloarchaea archaeon]